MGRSGKVTECGRCGHHRDNHGRATHSWRDWCYGCNAPCEFTPRIGRPPVPDEEKTVTRSYSMLASVHELVSARAKSWGCSASAAMARLVRAGDQHEPRE